MNREESAVGKEYGFDRLKGFRSLRGRSSISPALWCALTRRWVWVIRARGREVVPVVGLVLLPEQKRSPAKSGDMWARPRRHTSGGPRGLGGCLPLLHV